MNIERTTSIEAATNRNNVFDYDMSKAPLGQELIFLTIGAIAGKGRLSKQDIDGHTGIVAWSTLPVRNKELEERLKIPFTGVVYP